jgi:hypothetical protein
VTSRKVLLTIYNQCLALTHTNRPSHHSSSRRTFPATADKSEPRVLQSAQSEGCPVESDATPSSLHRLPQCRNINKLNFPWGTFGATSKPRCFPTYGFLVAECKTGISGGWCRRCQLLQLSISFISHGVLNKIRSDCEVTASSDLPNSSPPHQWRTQGGVSGVQTPLPLEIPKALQNRAKLNATVKNVLKKLLNLGRQHPKMFGKKGSKIIKLRRFAIVLH